MNITRHNYETYFLLYADNELSAPERKMVEVFVQENTDLKPELQLLLDTKLTPAPVVADWKSSLLKKEIELDTTQSALLMYLDKELPQDQHSIMEARIKKEQSLAQELKIWEQTRLQKDDRIEFKDKHLLYRHEAARVVGFRKWQYAAAAAVLLFGLYTGYLTLQKDTPSKTEMAKNTGKPAVRENKLPEDIKQPQKVTQQDAPLVTPADVASQHDVKNTASEVKHTDPVEDKQTTPGTTGNLYANNQEKKPVRELPVKPGLENINRQESNITDPIAVLNTNRIEKGSPEREPGSNNAELASNKLTAPARELTDVNIIPPMPDNNARTAGLNDNNPGNENNVFYLKDESLNRTKLGGVFRKVKRMIERNTNIRTGNGVKIAGFEIASK